MDIGCLGVERQIALYYYDSQARRRDIKVDVEAWRSDSSFNFIRATELARLHRYHIDDMRLASMKLGMWAGWLVGWLAEDSNQSLHACVTG